MKTTTLSLSARDEQAAYWAMRLDGSELSAADRAALDAWLAADPAHRAALAEYCQLSADLEQQMPLLEGIRDETAETPTALQAAQPSPWLRRPIWAGVVLTAAAAVALFFWLGAPPAQREILATASAEQRQLALADGTVVELNARTSLSFELARGERRVRLDEGEAFFSVAKDAARPFYVDTPHGAVRVTGTRFAVRTDKAGGFVVTVAEGSVQARGLKGPLTNVFAGDLFIEVEGRPVTRRLGAQELADALAWREGRVVFHQVTLREVLAPFARYHGRELVVDDAVAGLRLGGSFKLGDLPAFLETLGEALPIRVEGDPASGPLRIVARR
jgi:transmembrane sensor